MESSETLASSKRSSLDLTTLTGKINAHLREHHARTDEECREVMGSVEANMEALMDQHFSLEADPTRVSEMLLFHVMFSGQQYLECEHAQMVFGEGGARAVSYPVWKLCALLPLPRFAGLHPRLVAHIGLLASLWLPRDGSTLVNFFEDAVELLQSLEKLWSVAQDRGEESVFVPGTHLVALPRLSAGIGRSPLKVELSSKDHHFLCRAAMLRVAAKMCILMPVITMGTHAHAQLLSLLGRQLNAELRPDTEVLHQMSLEALLALLENGPPAGAMPQVAVDCLRLAGHALVPREHENEGGRGTDERTFRHLPAVQELIAKCLRRIFSKPNSGATSQTTGATPNCGLEAHAGYLASLTATLPRISQWWADCCRKRQSGGEEVPSSTLPLDNDRYHQGGVSLAREVAAAYAAAVEAHLLCPSISRASTAPAGFSGGKNIHGTPGAVGSRRREGTYGAGFTPRRRRHGGSNAALGTSAQHAHCHANTVPRHFRAAVGALKSVPCVQPELVRVLRALLERFVRVPIRVLQRSELDGWSRGGDGDGRRDVHSSSSAAEGARSEVGGDRDGEDSHGSGDMAPPPPRAPPVKKRRVTLEGGSLRAAAAGGDSDEASVLSRRGAARGVIGAMGHQRSGAIALFSGSERLPLYSGERVACEVLDIILSSASAAADYFETTAVDEMFSTGRANTACIQATSPAVNVDPAVGTGELGPSDVDHRGEMATKHVCTLLQHTAAITCAIRVLAPFADGVGRSAVTRGSLESPRAHVPGGGDLSRDPTGAKQASKGINGNKTNKWHVCTELPPVLVQLADGFAASVKAAERYGAHGKSGGDDSENRKAINYKTSSPATWSPGAAARLSDMLVTCAGALPLTMVALPTETVHSGAGGGGEQHHAVSHLTAAARSTAERSLEMLLAPESKALVATSFEGTDSLPAAAADAVTTGAGQPRGVRALSLWRPGLISLRDGGGGMRSSDVDAGGEFASRPGQGRAGVVPTILGSAAPEAPLVLKCFLLAAATASKLPAGSATGGHHGDEPKKSGEGGLGGGEGDGKGGRDNAQNSGSEGGSSNGGVFDAPFNTHDAFLAGLKHDSPLVRQCAVAALPLLVSRLGDEGRSDDDSANIGPWERRWLPVLLALAVDKNNPEGVRLELAAALPRLGASLFRAREQRQKEKPPPHLPATITTHVHGNINTGKPTELQVEQPLGPNAFADLLPLWPSLLEDKSAHTRAAAARGVLAAASAAPLEQLRATGAAGARVLRSLADMLACGDPEVAWVVAGGAGQFVADGGKILRALYAGGGRSGGEGGGNGDSEGADDQQDTCDDEYDGEDDEDTLGEDEERERERRLRERAVDRFIEAVNALLQKHGDSLREGRWQSLHEFTALLRALGSIGCESDPTDELGLNIYLWTLIRLVDVWVDEDNECGPIAHEQMVRVCNHGRVPLPKLLRLPLTPAPVSSAAAGMRGEGRAGRSTGVGGVAPWEVGRGVHGSVEEVVGVAAGRGDGAKEDGHLDSGSILAPLMAKLMETGHVEEFVDQALGSRDFRSFLENSVAHVLPVFVAGQQATAVEQLAALCDRFEVADARGKDPPQRLLNRHLPHVLTDVLMRAQSAWTGKTPSPGFQFLLNYFPKVSPKAMIEGVLPQILEQVSWQLCGPRAEQATVALQAVAHISYEHESAGDELDATGRDGAGDEIVASPPSKKSRSVKRSPKRGEAAVGESASKAKASMERKVEAMVTQQFLFLMSNVVSKRWSSRTTEDKIRAIQVLGRLVGFLSEDEAGGLFSKVMATLQSALADPHGTPAQARAAYRVMMGYILGLSDESLAENLSTIVVNVLALMEEVKCNDHTFATATATATKRGTASSSALQPPAKQSSAKSRRRERLENDALLKQALEYSRTGARGAVAEAAAVVTKSKATIVAEVSTSGAVISSHFSTRTAGGGTGGVGAEAGTIIAGRDESAEIRATAAALLRRLIVDKQESLRAHFHKIPFMPQLPDLPALSGVSTVLSQELGHPSLGQQLERLTPLLQDESTEVRRAALKHLLLVLRRDKERLAELVLKGGSEVDPAVSRLLKGLLELSTDSDGRIRDLCGACLGEVGAIDPARVGLTLRDGGAAHFGGGSNGQTLFEAAPWEMTVEEMSLLLLRDLLVPAFRASTTSMEQDRVAFGIQELLHLLGDSTANKKNAGGDGGSGRTSLPDRPAVGSIGGADEARVGPMPERLMRRLREAQVLSIVEPFWRSTYKLSDRAPSSSAPFFCDPAMTVSLERWLSSWCRNLISKARGPLRPAFEACRGAVRSHAPMAQFLLNHLVADVLIFGDQAAADQVLAEVLAVMRADAPPVPSSTSASNTTRTPITTSTAGTTSRPTAAAVTTATMTARSGTRGSAISSRTAPNTVGSSIMVRSRDGAMRSARGGGGGASGRGAAGGRGGGGIEHIATQATFRLLDRLGHWAAGRSRRSGSSGAAGGAGWPSDLDRKGALLGFVKRVPRGVLVKASMRVRAHTRALRYLEEQIRAEHYARQQSAGRSKRVLSSTGAFRNDGANGTLPVLNPAELHQLQAIYRRLSDEPDGMIGLDVMRGAAGVSASMKQRTWQHEHAEDWAGALEVYEQALQEHELKQQGQGSIQRGGIAASPDAQRTDPMLNRYDQMAAVSSVAASCNNKSTRRTTARELSQTQPLPGMDTSRDDGDRGGDADEDVQDKDGSGNNDDDDAVGFEGDEWDEGEVERGMLHAFVELGHLEMLLHQASGMLSVDSKRHLAPLLLPVAVEASWRLQRWPLLQDLLHQHKAGTGHVDGPWQGSSSVGPSASFAVDEQSGESRYRLALGKVMLRMQEGRPTPFSAAVSEARADVMAGLGAASMESYRRAYPFLLKLHSLREAEQAFEVMYEGRNPSTRRASFLALGWDERLSAMSSSLRQLAPVLAVRRAAFELCSLEDLQADNWLCLAKRARGAGQFAVAGAALRRACRLGMCQGKLAFQEAKLAREREGVHRALVILEPVETDVESLRALVSLDTAAAAGGGGSSSSSSRLPGRGASNDTAAVLDQEERLQIARKLLLTTDWIVEAGQKHGQAVVARYKLALQLRPGWEKGYFCLGQYVDFLFKSRVEELQRLASRAVDSGGGGDKKKARQGRTAGVRGWEADELAHRLALQAMDNYANSLRFGAKYIFQSMPRLLTLWFQVGFLRDPAAEDGGGQGGPRSLRSANAKAVATAARGRKRQAAQEEISSVLKLQSDSTELVRNTVCSIAPYMWYTALPQLTSRVGHPNTAVLKVIIEALAMLLKAHPKQALWHLSSLCLSISNTRRQVGDQVFERARRLLMEDGREGDAAAVKDGQALFSELIALAEEQPPGNQKEATFKIGHRMDLRRFIVPVQAGLTVSLPQAPRKDTPVGGGSMAAEVEAAASQAEVMAAAVVAAHNPFPGAEMHIRKFNERVKYMASKAKPKRVSLRTLETGEVVYFLCKQERNGDLRKDARLMEFNGMINRLLQKDPAGRARKLRLRTYAVICLNEECGVLEWVQDTIGFRHLVAKAIQIKSRRSSVRPASIGHIKSALDRVQRQSDRGILGDAVQMYRENILEHHPPCFHLWFVEHFAEPTAWFEARTTFARSAAVWSSVGHVVGLGDRHGENLLIHTDSGECVHVDFDCLFDKGLSLARPEIVPFRLTPGMVDGMGLCGLEGVYRVVMETCMSVLRTNRETLLSVLEPFLQDPTVGWGRSGRAQRSTAGSLGGVDLGAGGAGVDLGRERENEDADRVLRVINERLQGRYNLTVPRSPRPRSAADEGNDLPLSVQGQVHRLITEATSQQNLCQMYIGWMPWM